jgi:hypothetical protein
VVGLALGLLQGGWLAVAPAAWEGDLEPLLAARRAGGWQARFLALEDALASAPGADAPERLKQRLWSEWSGGGATHVLLVGDADVMPVRFMVLDRVAEAAHDTAFYASDLYYADAARADGSFDDWNFGEVRGEKHKEGPINHDGVSYLPELALGRWPVSDAEALRAVIAKTLAWERAPGAASALLLHAGEWVDERTRLGACGDELAAAGWTVARQFFGGEAEPTPARVSDALARAPGLLLHAGHGSADGWHACVGRGELQRLAGTAPAIWFSAGCSTAHLVHEPPYESYLDVAGIAHRGTNSGESFAAPPPPPAPLQPAIYNDSSFGEELLRLPSGGAVAYVGCVTGSQPAAVSLLDGFARAAAAGEATVGGAWRAAVRRYHAVERLDALVPTADWYPPSIYFQGMKFLLLGDPALPLPRPPRAD